VATLVVGGDGDVDVLGGRVGVGQGDDGDVDVAGLLDGLGVGAGVGHDDEAGLLERAGDVVGEATGGEATSDGGGAGVGGELEDGALTVGTGGDDADVGWVVDGDDDAGGEDNLLPTRVLPLAFLSIAPRLENEASTEVNVPGLANVENIDTVGASLPEVRLHVHLQVLTTQVALSSQEHLNVLGGGVERGGQVGGSHLV
jgi:hypothetical protein